MTDFIPRPYKLFNKIQHYEWGTRGESAFIPRFLGKPAEPNVPYAELWIGAHPKAPSEVQIGDRRIPLNVIVDQYGRECLGEHVSKKFRGRLPFLLKVLSAGRALSIQLHPDKEQAVRLHDAHPENYPDDNHKPEIAIAIDSLDALVGFKPAREIAASLQDVRELSEFADSGLFESVLLGEKNKTLEQSVRELYSDIMRKAEEKERLSSCIGKIRDRLSRKGLLAPGEIQFLKQYELYGDDIGLFSFFFFNLVRLKPGQAIFTDAGVPHAYIRGNIIECMANSDNVVRAGLTNKFKDVETLLDIMKYEFAACEIMNSEQKMEEVVYKTGADEFRIVRYLKPGGFKRDCGSNGGPSICLVAGGEIEVAWSHSGADHLKTFSKGDSFFIPAFLSGFRISSTDGVDCFFVDVP